MKGEMIWETNIQSPKEPDFCCVGEVGLSWLQEPQDYFRYLWGKKTQLFITTDGHMQDKSYTRPYVTLHPFGFVRLRSLPSHLPPSPHELLPPSHLSPAPSAHTLPFSLTLLPSTHLWPTWSEKRTFQEFLIKLVWLYILRNISFSSNLTVSS